MTADQFWYDEPSLVVAFRKAHTLRNQQKSEEMWMQGLYNFNAFMTALSNLNFDGKHREPNKYLEKPFDLIPKTKEQTEEDIIRQREEVIAHFSALGKSFNNKGGK